ncbi:tetratricopeptide (TPR) repeat protein [Rheinheimera pacifica]|uniref:tetratricopeptide repeat protein n=1 Tax=Rheinheimera pacifica TaxID=173990 RepID=UPI0028642A94|nr:tetratricopeptide repeat protein [Rheinheimera pacifica]MDR6981464.1 tetratricopeptide (TPR) repeat protein [Rheinheimera pacifica]
MAVQQFFQQALLYYQQHEFTKACELLNQITMAVPKHVASWHLLALSLRKLGHLADSERCFKTCLQLNPNDADAINNYANLQRQLGNQQHAEKMFRQAIKLRPNFIDARYNLALLLNTGKRHTAAQNCLRKLLELKPEHKAAMLVLARSYLNLGQTETAVELLDNWQVNNASDVDIKLLKAEVLRKQGFYQQAISLLSPWLHYNQAVKEIALCYYLIGNIAQAEHLLCKQLEAEPAEPSLLHLLAELRWQNGDAQWSSCYQTAVAADGTQPIVYVEYANKLLKADDISASEQVIDAGLQRSPDQAGLMLLKGYLCRERGEFHKALQWQTKCILASPTVAEIKSELVITRLALQQYSQATTLAQELCKKEPLNQAHWATLAACYKFSQDHKRYSQLYNFDTFVGVFSLVPPFGYTDIETFNQALLLTLSQLYVGHHHPLQQSLRQGTQTEDHLFCQKNSVVQLLQKQISIIVARYINSLPEDQFHPFLQRKSVKFRYSGAWSVRLREQGYHRSHYHSDGWISGCYYVHIPSAVDHAGSGWIKFGQPEMGSYLKSQPDYMLKPAAGLLVLFPSMMWHGTEPFTDNEHRVTVAFDVVPEELEEHYE